ncbi:hypothetical protein BCF11_4670 [Collimonas sp. PA-H2]|uniref:hypothetical protein n=1 Tax=Collimonas sp. PA-H2 TaxID=1881062 RepID=UPI000BF47E93|nr:hypothetical protein [Collimonas sp. PA-H2]PFH12193.1 hypothetical protein BCF11_4670 [Collimonas sp. PA-H2]
MKNVLFAFAMIVSAGGCAMSPAPINNARSVPMERVFRADALPLANNARAIFVRDAGFSGASAYQHLYIDGKKAASLNPGEKIEFMLAPGEHVFGATPTDGLNTRSLNALNQDLKADKTYFYRIQTEGSSFRTTVQRFVPDYQ